MRCCKPIPNVKCSKKLRNINDALRIKLPVVVREKEKICSSCYIKVMANEVTEATPIGDLSQNTQHGISSNSVSSRTTSPSCRTSACGESPVRKRAFLEALNPTLSVLNISPIYESRVYSRPMEVKNKLQKLTTYAENICYQENVEPDILNLGDLQRDANYFNEMVNQFKEKLEQLHKASDKIHLLTVLPKSFTREVIIEKFGVSDHVAKTVKILQESKGIFSKPDAKRGNSLPCSVINKVREYFDEVSRIMPGKNDCITIGREKVQKRLLMNTLRECYQDFKEQFCNDSSMKIGFSKFATLKPKYCVQLGSSGTHNICVCTIHQNFKLLMHAIKLPAISEGVFSDYRKCIDKVLCSNPMPNCFLLECKSCPGLEAHKQYIKALLGSNGYEYDDEIKFHQWISTDRCDLETVVKTCEEFLEYYIEKLKKLIPHYFISSQQSEFLKTKKSLIDHGEVIVLGDFSENYSFVIQNEAQGFHWNKKQATIHPYVTYYKNEKGETEHVSFVVISECLTHDVVAVHLFNEKLIEFLKSKLELLTKIYYFTDGAASQYKNKKKI